ncbi:MAG: helix-turn-helix transcriptional regulator [Eubacterium sp.]|nr:helix-turn-helix transcriptional regulator [Eubacterium sp.]
MNDSEFGTIKLHLKELMEERNLSLTKLSFRAEIQRTQLKHYYDEDIQRLNMTVLSRLCYVLNCTLNDLIEYIPPEDSK